MNFLELVLKELERKNITLYELSKRTGIKDNTLSNWKNGKSKNLSFENSLIIAKELNISIDKIIGLNKNIFSNEDIELIRKYKAADNGTKAAVNKLLDIDVSMGKSSELKIG